MEQKQELLLFLTGSTEQPDPVVVSNKLGSDHQYYRLLTRGKSKDIFLYDTDDRPFEHYSLGRELAHVELARLYARSAIYRQQNLKKTHSIGFDKFWSEMVMMVPILVALPFVFWLLMELPLKEFLPENEFLAELVLNIIVLLPLILVFGITAYLYGRYTLYRNNLKFRRARDELGLIEGNEIGGIKAERKLSVYEIEVARRKMSRIRGEQGVDTDSSLEPESSGWISLMFKAYWLAMTSDVARVFSPRYKNILGPVSPNVRTMFLPKHDDIFGYQTGYGTALANWWIYPFFLYMPVFFVWLAVASIIENTSMSWPDIPPSVWWAMLIVVISQYTYILVMTIAALIIRRRIVRWRRLKSAMFVRKMDNDIQKVLEANELVSVGGIARGDTYSHKVKLFS